MTADREGAIGMSTEATPKDWKKLLGETTSILEVTFPNSAARVRAALDHIVELERALQAANSAGEPVASMTTKLAHAVLDDPLTLHECSHDHEQCDYCYATRSVSYKEGKRLKNTAAFPHEEDCAVLTAQAVISDPLYTKPPKVEVGEPVAWPFGDEHERMKEAVYRMRLVPRGEIIPLEIQTIAFAWIKALYTKPPKVEAAEFAQYMKFYAVETVELLILAQASHIEKLQEKLSRLEPKQMARSPHVREG